MSDTDTGSPTSPKLRTSGAHGYLKDFVALRHFMWHLAQARLRSRFRRSVLGIVWLVLNPVIIAAIFVTVFGQIFAADNMFVYAGYIILGHMLYDFFGQTLSGGAGTFLEAQNYLRQHRIPALIFPAANLLYNLVTTIIGMVGLIVIGLFVGAYEASPTLVVAPLIIFAYAAFLAPLSVISAIAGLKFGDFAQLIVYVTMLFYYLSPVFIPREVFDAPHLQPLTTYSPLINVMDAVRACVMYGEWPELRHFLVIFGWSGGLAVLAGVWLWREEKRIVFYT